MLTIQNYIKADSLSQAYELNQKKSSRIIGGMLWLKMSQLRVQNAIDLSGLGLDTIEESEEEYRIGCMVTLRQLELHPGLNALSQGAMRESVRHIVGVQFRNLATVGGSIYGRYGFSDVLTILLALNARVELFQGGIIPLSVYAAQPKDRDILVRILVPRQPLSCIYLSQRKTRTDFPVLTCALAQREDEISVTIGARPGRAITIADTEHILTGSIGEENARAFAAFVRTQVPTGSNMRGSSEYRSLLAEVLTRRAVLALGGDRK